MIKVNHDNQGLNYFNKQNLNQIEETVKNKKSKVSLLDLKKVLVDQLLFLRKDLEKKYEN